MAPPPPCSKSSRYSLLGLCSSGCSHCRRPGGVGLGLLLWLAAGGLVLYPAAFRGADALGVELFAGTPLGVVVLGVGLLFGLVPLLGLVPLFGGALGLRVPGVTPLPVTAGAIRRLCRWKRLSP